MSLEYNQKSCSLFCALFANNSKQFVKIKSEEISCTNSAVIPKMHFFHWYSNLSYENSAILYFMNRFKIWYEFRLNLSSFCQREWHFYPETFYFFIYRFFKQVLSPGIMGSSSKNQLNFGFGLASTIPSKKTLADSSTAAPSIFVTNLGGQLS